MREIGSEGLAELLNKNFVQKSWIEHVALMERQGRRKRQPGMSPELRDGHIQIGQVVTVEHHLLTIHLSPTHSQAVKKSELGCMHLARLGRSQNHRE